ncbi:Flp family type IVb pilin [Taylorella asinigenitalis]|uniref:Integral membrane protein n=1 Tax=Taylorella asinigenitalis (strain MCE3) TaxID=1008459 RepID=G4QB05_TAYAM|nr:hypothetical protein [Taylorella asinigenitalis]AEP36546.1 integral membrane protein [Taylorella asinigenitalis MCE3]
MQIVLQNPQKPLVKKQSLKRRLGQGMTEYIIIVALVSVAAIAVYQLFGQVIRSQTAAMAKEIAGEDGTAQSKKAQTAAKKAESQTSAKSLKTFTGNAKQAGGR